jgi:hypothetical protein
MVSDVAVVGEVASLSVAFLLGLGLYLCAFRVLTDAPASWADVLPGAVVAAVGWAVLQVVGGAFVQRVIANASDTAGVFAVVIGLLSWLYLVAQISVLSAEVNVVRREQLWPRSMTGRDLGDGDTRALARYAAARPTRADRCTLRAARTRLRFPTRTRGPEGSYRSPRRDLSSTRVLRRMRERYDWLTPTRSAISGCVRFSKNRR